ncbi:MAG: hypothetical protein WC544_04580 [Patescibacteria group bacterium]
MDSPNQPKSNPSMSKPLAWVILIVVVLILACGTYFLLQQEDSNTSNGNTAVNTVVNRNSGINTNTTANSNVSSNGNSAANTNVAVNTNVDTTGWKTYKFTNLDISIELPTDWVVEHKNFSSGSFQEDNAADNYIVSPPENKLDFMAAANCYISQFPITKNEFITSWIEQSNIYVTSGTGEGLNIIDQHEISIGPYTGLYVREGAGGPQETISFYFRSNSSLIRFGYYKGVVVEPYSQFQSFSNTCAAILKTLN